MSRPALRVRAPVVVRYDKPLWVPDLLADPTGPGLGPPEVWRYLEPPLSEFPVPHPTAFQSNHDRFYAVVTELEPPGNDVSDIQVSLVIRRERYEVVPGPSLFRLARKIAADTGARLSIADLTDLLFAAAFVPLNLRLRYRQDMRRRGATRKREVQLDPGGWSPMSSVFHRHRISGEREYPMWRRPDAVRNQWFGSLPSEVPFHEVARPDDRWTYRMHCVARWTPPDCRPGAWVSVPGAPFRIAPLRMPATGG
ncbi:hypothetical protein BJ973_008850 [Actinoplanes tereljensis]|uniref:Uncharacterized protein n=1 Tax=Paractinoplanes tereljensis TaxID=571912 RepID=A0A919TRK8_9ACTN|nr:hypothetical protein [Actinoplanes tereljensis]GIF18187.1 hypothetical protein Ate02nite_09170 [Actinoplanes tereljensis]